MENVSLKLKKEAFVSGLNGTSLLEITIITNIPVVLGLARAILIFLLPVALLNNKLVRFFFEWIVMVSPVIAVTTILSDDIYVVFVTLLVTCITTILLIPSKSGNLSDLLDTVNVNLVRQPNNDEIVKDEYLSSTEDKKQEKTPSILEMEILSPSRLPFLTTFRAYTTIISCICILAVDFNIFPRRLAKTEVFGAGLMDAGVGLFVVSNAIVSTEARAKKEYSNSILDKLYRVWLNFVYSWPLWLIGLIRVVSVKIIGYQEHVTEYGVHWNFFFTLAAVKVAATFLLAFSHTTYSLPMGAGLALLYQYLLSSTTYDLTGLILNDERSGFLMANKEGILSCIGYLAIYLISVHVGRYFLKIRRTLIHGVHCCITLAFVNALLWCLLSLSSSYIQPISRRFANMSYVIWIVALSMEFCVFAMLTDLLLVYAIASKRLPIRSMPDQWILFPQNQVSQDKISYTVPPPSESMTTAVNRNQLAYFLLSNLATGLVNFLFNTIEQNDKNSLVIISVYCASILLFIWILHVKQVTLKFW